MTKFLIGVKDKDVWFMRRLALFHGMRPEKYLEEVVESWLAQKRSEMKGLSAPQTTGRPLSSPTALDAARSLRSSATRVAIRFAETAEDDT